MVKSKRSRTPSKYTYYALYLYFSGLSLRKTSEHLLPFVKRNHVFQYGNGFNIIIDQRKYCKGKEKKYRNLS